MQCSRTFLFQMCLSLLVSTGSCRCKPLSEILQDEGREGYYSGLTGRDVVEEDEEEADADSRLERILRKMKEDFLRQLNLTEAPQEPSRIYPPQFMMELYDKYASDTSAMPRSDVIRSFTLQGVSLSERNGNRSRHRLLFNVTVPHNEEVSRAEVRLFTRLEGRSTTSSEVRATIRVYEVDYTGSKPTLFLLDGREVIAPRPSWEAFDVTHAMQGWVKSSRGGGGGVSEFEVVVDRWDSGGLFKDGGGGGGGGGGGVLSVCVAVGDNTSAALIVFSDDLGSRRAEVRKELKEMILHEEDTILSSDGSPPKDWDRDRDRDNNSISHINNDNNNNISSSSTVNPSSHSNNKDIINSSNRSNPTYLQPRKRRRRRRRQTENNYCRRTSMRVSFKDIGWDKWIVAPPEYDAFECRGVCYYPLTDDMTPSKHALIQTLVNLRDPKKANMACCVPTKLDPITVMYQENGVITVRHMYEEMKVAQCGCR